MGSRMELKLAGCLRMVYTGQLPVCPALKLVPVAKHGQPLCLRPQDDLWCAEPVDADLLGLLVSIPACLIFLLVLGLGLDAAALYFGADDIYVGWITQFGADDAVRFCEEAGSSAANPWLSGCSDTDSAINFVFASLYY
ncbi:hypothetical protein Nepgr_033538 [Nepenthes gracilis]|uniref:Uncharacterized protein n=1 Tax=Nepenthes gracilis TaxID=150966 RepID=A0AAD3Y8Q8_NEPGR|nr:hypothetical protein Nepgr_033538 [Nepenthes gracilis]